MTRHIWTIPETGCKINVFSFIWKTKRRCVHVHMSLDQVDPLPQESTKNEMRDSNPSKAGVSLGKARQGTVDAGLLFSALDPAHPRVGLATVLGVVHPEFL